MAKVLIADDKPDVCRALEATLKSAGHSVVAATTVEKAVKFLELSRSSEPFEVVVVDLWFENYEGALRGPSEAGLIVVDKALEDRLVEIIVLTAHGTTKTAAEACAVGVFRYLEKGERDDYIDSSGGLMKEIVGSVAEAVAVRDQLRKLSEMLYCLGEVLSEARKIGTDVEVVKQGQVILSMAREILELLLRYRGKKTK